MIEPILQKLKGPCENALKDAKMKPHASIHWDGKDLDFSGDNPAMGDRVRLVIEGKITDPRKYFA